MRETSRKQKPWMSGTRRKSPTPGDVTTIVCPDGVHRCPWVGKAKEAYAYHDKEWGRPDHSNHFLAQELILGGFQSGLSWRSVLRKRANFQKDFDGFNLSAVANFGRKDVERLMADPGIIRNRRKIEGAIANARMILAVEEQFGSLHDYVWHWTFGHRVFEPITTTTDPLSDLVAADLKRRGSRFLGSVTIFSYLQACGSICSHTPGCVVFDRFPPRKGDIIGRGYPTGGLRTDGDIHFA